MGAEADIGGTKRLPEEDIHGSRGRIGGTKRLPEEDIHGSRADRTSPNRDSIPHTAEAGPDWPT